MSKLNKGESKSKSMDIGYVLPVVYPFVKGGVEKRAHEIGTRLSSRGHNITVYSRHWWDGPKEVYREGIILKSVAPSREIYANGDQRSIKSAIEFSAHVGKELLRKGSSHDILSTPVAPYFPVFTASIASKWHNTPLVVTWHEVWGDYWYDYMGGLGLFGNLVERAAAELPHHAITPSETTDRKLRQISRQNISPTIIPNGIDVEQIRSTSPVSDGYDVLYVGRLIEDKNVNLLIDAFNSLESNVTLGIIGEGPQLDSLRSQVKRLPCSDRVEFLGFLEDYEDVIKHMRRADVFVSPSVREGFGITLIEALAAGCIVIAADHPNTAAREVLGDGGFLVEPEIEAIKNTIQRALRGEMPNEDPVSRARQYDWERVTDKTEEFYSKLC